jgi:hypothetical protein
MADTLGGGNETDVTFVAPSGPAVVDGFGAVFLDPDVPGISGLTVFDADDAPIATASVPVADGEVVFRGIVTVDDATGLPVPAIARVAVTNGTGWPGASFNDGVLLDDFVSGTPGPGQGTTSTTTVPGATTTSTTVAHRACGSVPATDCRKPVASGRSMLVVRDRSNDARDTLAWVWGNGAATAKSEFGDPAGAAGFVLCLYDATGLRHTLDVPAGGRCGGKLCWRTTPAGFVFNDPGGGSGSLLSLRLKGGTDGRARIALLARGEALMSLALPLTPPLAVQLLRADGVGCWDARFSLAKTGTRRLLRARAD